MYYLNDNKLDLLYSSMPKGCLWGVGLVIIDSKGNNILLEKRSDTKTWSTPGGHVDPGETPVDACLRECKEEVGVDITCKPTCYGITYTHGGEGIFTTFWFYVRLDKDTVTVKRQLSEVDAVAWTPVNDVLDLDMYDVSKDAFIALLRNYPEIVYGTDVIQKLTSMEQKASIKNPGTNGGNVSLDGNYKKNTSGSSNNSSSVPFNLTKEAVANMLEGFSDSDIDYSEKDSQFSYPAYKDMEDSKQSFSSYAENFVKQYFAYAVRKR